MTSLDSEKARVRVISLFQHESIQARTKKELEKHFPGRVDFLPLKSLQEAIDRIEQHPEKADLLMIEHESPSLILLKTLMEMMSQSVHFIITNQPALFEALLTRENAPEIIEISNFESSLYRALKKYSLLMKIPPLDSEDPEEYLPINIDTLRGLSPLQTDVYSKLGQDRFVCVFRTGHLLEETDLAKFILSKRTEFHVKKSEIKAVLAKRAQELEESAQKPGVSPEVMQKAFTSAHTLIRDVVPRMGFTAETQNIAKSCVNMTLKALGAKPKLSAIIDDLKKKEGDYIAAHSHMVGNVACALAHRIGWNSSATFFKLGLAGFLHDISVVKEEHARVHTLIESESSPFTKDELKLIRLHPVQCAEYSKQFSEIPSDVDIIIAQHHERPDGEGFPRKLAGKLISPLSALFIMAQDLVHEVFEHPETLSDDFFRANAEKYQVGQFKKIITLILNTTEESDA